METWNLALSKLLLHSPRSLDEQWQEEKNYTYYKAQKEKKEKAEERLKLCPIHKEPLRRYSEGSYTKTGKLKTKLVCASCKKEAYHKRKETKETKEKKEKRNAC